MLGGVVLAQVLAYGLVVALGVEYARDGQSVDELNEAVLDAGGDHLVGREPEVEVLLLEQLVHERDHLEHELVLAQIVADLVDGRVLGRCARRVARQRLEHELARHQIALEHGRLLHVDAANAHARIDDERHARVKVDHVEALRRRRLRRWCRRRRVGGLDECRAQFGLLFVAAAALATRRLHDLVEALHESLLVDYAFINGASVGVTLLEERPYYLPIFVFVYDNKNEHKQGQ